MCRGGALVVIPSFSQLLPALPICSPRAPRRNTRSFSHEQGTREARRERFEGGFSLYRWLSSLVDARQELCRVRVYIGRLG
ncbi:hypothetical protein GGR52DRAFT_323522 [Hypoxylon sp. FL1284]|nr:hypothetical protein GGR52DRAFT_323522 [Hypoxylon sp. FL1284]